MQIHINGKTCPFAEVEYCDFQGVVSEVVSRNYSRLNIVTVFVSSPLLSFHAFSPLASDRLSLTTSNAGGRDTQIDGHSGGKLFIREVLSSTW